MSNLNYKRLFNLDGRVAIITGASKGIGAAIAQALAEFGAIVVLSSRKQEAVDDLARQLQDEGFLAWAKACHVGDQNQRKELIDSVIAKYGRLDILVNNAAISPHYGSLEEITDVAFHKTMEVNLEGARILSNLAAIQMKVQKKGSIIHLSSIEAMHPGQGMGAYSISKAALNMLTMSQAKEWGSSGIRVNAIAPGLIQTKFSTALTSNNKLMDHIRQNVPAGRIGQPEEIAGLAVFLASDASSYCTGGIYLADGGFMLSGGL
ncbi:MAG: glucose 1-dehydrogenase [Saprospiraceae bacterium]|nr:glucose 1-dehydrogenase [Saprospiraceae bacterium]